MEKNTKPLMPDLNNIKHAPLSFPQGLSIRKSAFLARRSLADAAYRIARFVTGLSSKIESYSSSAAEIPQLKRAFT